MRSIPTEATPSLNGIRPPSRRLLPYRMLRNRSWRLARHSLATTEETRKQGAGYARTLFSGIILARASSQTFLWGNCYT